MPTTNEKAVNSITELSAFSFDNKQVRSIQLVNKPWFVGVDVGEAMGIENPRPTILNLDEDQKLPYILYTAGQRRSVTLISESGLYALAFQSRKPEAKRFCKMVTDVVLPSIRKYGFYIPGATGVEGKLKDVPFDYFGEGKRKAYQYRVGMRALGLNPHSGYANSRIKEYPAEFFKSEGVWYICETFLEVLAMSNAFRETVKPLKEKIKRLPPMAMLKAVNQLDLFNQQKEGGSHDNN